MHGVAQLVHVGVVFGMFTPALAHSRLRPLRALSLFHGLPQNDLDLRVDAAQIVRRPLLEVLPELRRYSKQERLTLRRHGQAYSVPVLMTGDGSDMPTAL